MDGATGYLVEDSSKVQILNDPILAVAENGIEIKNSRDVILQDNRVNIPAASCGIFSLEFYKLLLGWHQNLSMRRDFCRLDC